MLAVQVELQDAQEQVTTLQQQNEEYEVALADKERTLQATKGDLIEARMDVHRTEQQLQVCFCADACVSCT